MYCKISSLLSKSIKKIIKTKKIIDIKISNRNFGLDPNALLKD